MSAPGPNWAEEVTAIATALGAIGLLGAVVAAVFAGQQVREARRASQVQLAADFIRRWDEDSLVEARRLINRFQSKEGLREAFRNYGSTNAPEAYVMLRELDFFEQMGALEREGALPFSLIQRLIGRLLLARWDLWEPTINSMPEGQGYPMFEQLAFKLKAAGTG